MIEIYNKARAFFDNINTNTPYVAKWSSEALCKKFTDALCKKFTDAIVDLYPKIVTKEMVVFCEEEPKEEDYNLGDIHAGYFRKEKEAWQQRKDKFEPLFVGEWREENTRSNEWLTDGLLYFDINDTVTVEQLVQEEGFTLNPKHPLVPKYYSEVNEFNL